MLCVANFTEDTESLKKGVYDTLGKSSVVNLSEDTEFLRGVYMTS